MSVPHLFVQPFGDPRNAVTLLHYLIYLDPFNLNFSALQNDIPIGFPDTPRVVNVLPQDSTISNCCIVASGNSCTIFAGGTDGSQVPGLIQGWVAPSGNDRIATGANDHLQNAAARLFSAIPPSVGKSADFFLAGHSYGGATLEVLAAYLVNARQPASVNIWTFGAPRPGTSQFQSWPVGLNLWRYFNDTDPVPEVPPHTLEAPLVHVALPNNWAFGMNQQVQMSGGIRVASDGSFTYTNEQTLPLVVNEPSLVAWLTGLNMFGAQAHNPREYQRRLILSPTPPPAEIGPNRFPEAPPEAPLDINVRALHQITDAAVANMPTETVPPGLPQLVPGMTADRYTIRRHRGGWGVWYQGSMVALCRTKRAARAVARAGNNTNAVNERLLPA